MIIWLINGFILVRQIIFQFNFWSLTMITIAELYIGISAGRSKVELKLLKIKEKETQELIKSGRASRRSVGVVELEPEDVSVLWKSAI